MAIRKEDIIKRAADQQRFYPGYPVKSVESMFTFSPYNFFVQLPGRLFYCQEHDNLTIFVDTSDMSSEKVKLPIIPTSGCRFNSDSILLSSPASEYFIILSTKLQTIKQIPHNMKFVFSVYRDPLINSRFFAFSARDGIVYQFHIESDMTISKPIFTEVVLFDVSRKSFLVGFRSTKVNIIPRSDIDTAKEARVTANKGCKAFFSSNGASFIHFSGNKCISVTYEECNEIDFPAIDIIKSVDPVIIGSKSGNILVNNIAYAVDQPIAAAFASDTMIYCLIQGSSTIVSLQRKDPPKRVSDFTNSVRDLTTAFEDRIRKMFDDFENRKQQTSNTICKSIEEIEIPQGNGVTIEMCMRILKEKSISAAICASKEMSEKNQLKFISEALEYQLCERHILKLLEILSSQMKNNFADAFPLALKAVLMTQASEKTTEKRQLFETLMTLSVLNHQKLPSYSGSAGDVRAFINRCAALAGESTF